MTYNEINSTVLFEPKSSQTEECSVLPKDLKGRINIGIEGALGITLETLSSEAFATRIYFLLWYIVIVNKQYRSLYIEFLPMTRHKTSETWSISVKTN